ncbi:MAG: DUF4292 domain-containing protein [Muribaculaceae bacterium]|nr:DUF4292 domain-containing protein [Muribaculaceae bacterium]
MKINRKILGIAFLLYALTFLGACASKKSVTAASTSPSAYADSRAVLLQDALNRYGDWSSVQLSGKLHLESLPVSPSLKIYMKRGKELTISASAILVGEVFRAELTEDSLLIVNKLKKIYCKESGDKLRQIYPTLCEEVQSLLLGRMIVPGNGPLSVANIDKVNIEMENDIRKVMPELGDFPIEVGACYLLDGEGKLSDLIVEGDAGKRLFSLNYAWKGNGGSDIHVSLQRKNRPLDIDISLDSPKWDASPLSPCKIGKGFRKVGLQEFFKSI